MVDVDKELRQHQGPPCDILYGRQRECDPELSRHVQNIAEYEENRSAHEDAELVDDERVYDVTEKEATQDKDHEVGDLDQQRWKPMQVASHFVRPRTENAAERTVIPITLHCTVSHGIHGDKGSFYLGQCFHELLHLDQSGA